MNVNSTVFDVKTPSRDAMIDVTGEVQRIVTDSGVTEGTATVYVTHTTG